MYATGADFTNVFRSLSSIPIPVPGSSPAEFDAESTATLEHILKQGNRILHVLFFFLRAGFFANEFSAVADSVQSVRPRLLPNYTPRACTLGRSPPMTSLFPCPSFLIRFAASNVGGNGRGAARTLGDVGRVSRTHHQGLLLPFFAVYSYIFSNLLTLCL